MCAKILGFDFNNAPRQVVEPEDFDLDAIAADCEARAAEEAAKTRLEELARQKLGVERNGDESLEDAARRRAQEAVAAEAERLLRGALGGSN